MKKLSMLSLLLVLLLGTGCKKEYYTENVPNYTVVTTVQSSEWAYNTTDGTYNARISMPEIDDVVFNNDGIVVAAMFDGVNYEGLPQVYGGYTYTYFYQPGYLTISIQGATGSEGGRPTGGIKFKIVLIPSQQ
jgi:hypothetical protein